MSRPQNSFWTLHRPQKNHLGPKKSKITPKSKVRIEENIEKKKSFNYMSGPQNSFSTLPQPWK